MVASIAAALVAVAGSINVVAAMLRAVAALINGVALALVAPTPTVAKMIMTSVDVRIFVLSHRQPDVALSQ